LEFVAEVVHLVGAAGPEPATSVSQESKERACKITEQDRRERITQLVMYALEVDRQKMIRLVAKEREACAKSARKYRYSPEAAADIRNRNLTEGAIPKFERILVPALVGAAVDPRGENEGTGICESLQRSNAQRGRATRGKRKRPYATSELSKFCKLPNWRFLRSCLCLHGTLL